MKKLAIVALAFALPAAAAAEVHHFTVDPAARAGENTASFTFTYYDVLPMP